jgi:hypothetical protein
MEILKKEVIRMDGFMAAVVGFVLGAVFAWLVLNIRRK